MSAATVAEIEAKYGQTVVAIVYDDDGKVYDHCFTWESGQSYALSQGMIVEAIADDGYMTIDRAQSLYDAERDRYRDCFGLASR